MISYELAKQLKDAGFPLEKVQQYLYDANVDKVFRILHPGKPEVIIDVDGREHIYTWEYSFAYPLPSLEELIEEVKSHILQIQFSGDNNFSKSNNNVWTVFQNNKDLDAFMSKDLDIALALLWLDLNKK